MPQHQYGLGELTVLHLAQPVEGGVARVVTDLATFAWLCDVYVDREHRGLGIGTWLTATIRDYLAPYRLKRVLLSTKDAHEVYARAGFVQFPDPDGLMYMSFVS